MSEPARYSEFGKLPDLIEDPLRASLSSIPEATLQYWEDTLRTYAGRLLDNAVIEDDLWTLPEDIRNIPRHDLLIAFRSLPPAMILDLFAPLVEPEVMNYGWMRQHVLDSVHGRGTNLILDNNPVISDATLDLDNLEVNLDINAACRFAAHVCLLEHFRGYQHYHALQKASEKHKGQPLQGHSRQMNLWEAKIARSRIKILPEIPNSPRLLLGTIVPCRRPPDRTGIIVDRPCGSGVLVFHSYWPTVGSNSMELVWRESLDGAAFEHTFRMSLSRFERCWSLLNEYAITCLGVREWGTSRRWSLRETSHNQWRASVLFHAARTGLVQVPREVVDTLPSTTSGLGTYEIDKNEWRIFVSLISSEDPAPLSRRLLERTSALICVTEESSVLDLSRVGTLYRALIRTATARSGAMGEVKGRAIERRVERGLSKVVPRRALRANVKFLTNGQIDRQLDCMVLVEGIIFAIEIKSDITSERFHAGVPSHVVGRYDRFETYLRDLDKWIEGNQMRIRNHYSSDTVIGILGVLCVDENDPIISKDRLWWIDSHRLHPRVTDLEEFIHYLRLDYKPVLVVDHPAFVSSTRP